MRTTRGFTLIEVLIAMAITALVATLSFSSLSAVLGSVEGLRAEGERISDVNRAWRIISRDLQQFTPRPVRDEFGAAQSALIAGPAQGQGLSFTRAGWHNPNQRLRSDLQRVHYYVEDDALWRESYLVLDRTAESEPQRVKLLDAVVDFQVRLLSPAVDWRGADADTDDWPDNWGINASDNAVIAPPQGLELRLEMEDWGELRWLYDLPG